MTRRSPLTGIVIEFYSLIGFSLISAHASTGRNAAHLNPF